MFVEKSYTADSVFSLGMMLDKLRDYSAFVKLRLASLVVFSAATGFLLAPGTAEIDWSRLLILVISGFLVTCSSNGFNQIVERDLDKLMDRTANRPLPANRMSISESYLLATIMGLIGLGMLFFYINPLSCGLATFALLSYIFAYTPLKQKTPFAVLVGAFPGAIPPLLGWVAATNYIGMGGLMLFSIQFMWQFPHFWAIAWVLDDDYKKAGFKMLPSGRDKASAFQILVYSIGLLPISLLPIAFNMSGAIAGIIISIVGVWFLLIAIRLYQSCDLAISRKLMLASFIYLPVVQLALIIDKL